jgi:hypothetical protein
MIAGTSDSEQLKSLCSTRNFFADRIVYGQWLILKRNKSIFQEYLRSQGGETSRLKQVERLYRSFHVKDDKLVIKPEQSCAFLSRCTVDSFGTSFPNSNVNAAPNKQKGKRESSRLRLSGYELEQGLRLINLIDH